MTVQLAWQDLPDGRRLVENIGTVALEVVSVRGRRPLPPGGEAMVEADEAVVNACSVSGPAKYGRTLAEQWNEYRGRVMPPTVGETQLRETRRAFYAGAQALQQVMAHGVSDEADMTDADERLMLSIDAEFVQFAADVKAGRA